MGEFERVCEFVRGGESERDEIAGVGVGLGSSRVGLLESNRGLELGNLPGPVRERREGVAPITSLPAGATLRCRCETSLPRTTPSQN